MKYRIGCSMVIGLLVILGLVGVATAQQPEPGGTCGWRAKRIRHHAKDTYNPSQVHDVALVKQLLREEVQDILARLPATVSDEKSRVAYIQAEARYHKAFKIALRWIKNYTGLNFQSLGSYTRAELEAIAAAEDAF